VLKYPRYGLGYLWSATKRSLWPLHLRLADTVNANTSTGIPLGVVGRPDEIADEVVWMVKTGYFAHMVVIVDGGMLPQ
jgi:hypothetical protein